MTQFKDTPEKLVDKGRVVDYGLFKEPFKDLNIREAQIFETRTPEFLRNLRIKEWQHYAIINDEFFMGFVINNNHYLGMSFCYVYERDNKRFVEHHMETPLPVAKVANELWNDACHFNRPGYNLVFHNQLNQKHHKIEIAVEPQKGKPGIFANLELLEDLDSMQPLITVLPLGDNRPLYTHKMVCPVSGSIRLGDREVELKPEKDIGLIDVQKTYYPYNTFWNWATLGGRDSKGRIIGLNLVQNIIKDDETHNENVIWVDGKLSKISAARFTIDDSDYMKPWKIETTDGRCKLTFTPIGERAERINMGLILSDYHQPYGIYEGELTDDAGETHKVDGFFGVTEKHLARF